MPGFIDARGKACPMPVVLAKQQLDKGEQKLTVMVDNETAVENLKRLASHCGAETEVEYRTDGIAVIFNGGNADTEQKNISDICECKKGGYTIFFGKDTDTGRKRTWNFTGSGIQNGKEDIKKFKREVITGTSRIDSMYGIHA